MTPRDGLPPEPGPDDVRQPPVGWLPDAADALFGDGAEASEAYGLLTVDVPLGGWVTALSAARDDLGCTYFDWLSAVDEPGTGLRVCAHLVALPTSAGGVRRLVVRTTVPHDAAVLPTATGVYAGAAWHERETHEMFGLDFTDHPGLDPLLLPESFEGHPLRKDFVLAARVVKAWPGAKEPGESGHGGGSRRRQMRPPGVPDPNEWGPQAGRKRAPDEPPARPGPASRRPDGEPADRPAKPHTAGAGSDTPSPGPRRTRSAGGGSASQRAADAGGGVPGEPGSDGPSGPRRARSASGGSASQRGDAAASGGGADGRPSEPRASGPRRSRSAGGGSASQRSADVRSSGPRRSRSASEGSVSRPADTAPDPDTGSPAGPAEESAGPRREADAEEPGPAGAAGGGETGPRSADAPWHHARPAFDDEERDNDNSDDHDDEERG